MPLLAVVAAGIPLAFVVLAYVGRRLRTRSGPNAKAPIKEQVTVTLNRNVSEEE